MRKGDSELEKIKKKELCKKLKKKKTKKRRRERAGSNSLYAIVTIF